MKKLTLRLIIPIAFIIFLIKGIVYYNGDDYQYDWDYSIENKTGLVAQKFKTDHKLRGLSLYGLGRTKDYQLQDIIKSNVEWIAVHPYFYQESETLTTISSPQEVGQMSQKDSLFLSEINRAKKSGFAVMLKPHLWVGDGWRSNIHFEKKEQWLVWFDSYKKQMLYYAEMAEKTNVQLLCIGTELKSSIKNLSEEWLQFVKEIKEVYSGQLTYAANWNDPILEMNPDFWKELDYVGIQGYYPLTKTINPKLEDILKGWEKHLITLDHISKTFNKPILFTEIGYRPDTEATIKPWEWNAIFWSPLTTKVSTKTQKLAFEAFFQSLWNKEWFAGSFIWQWRSYDFGIQGKPAQNVMTKWYK